MSYLETIQELLEAKEGEHVQFKEAKRRFDSGEAAKCCCALANNGGGKLVFGITDKRPRMVVGSEAFDQPERTRMGLIEKLKINVDFQIFNYEGKRVLVFDVKSRPIGLPVQYDGVAWIYEGDTLKPMPEDMRRSIYEETGGDFSGIICAVQPLKIWMIPLSKISAASGLKRAAKSSWQRCQKNSFSMTVAQSRMMV
jgi:ATP-dependent DNA helicase RecG